MSDSSASTATKTRQGTPARPKPGNAADPDRRPSGRTGRAPLLLGRAGRAGARRHPRDSRPPRHPEFDRYLAERTEQPRELRRPPARSGRRSRLPAGATERIHCERADGRTLAEIAQRLNRDGIPTGQGGRQWWASSVSGSPRSLRAGDSLTDLRPRRRTLAPALISGS
jgi:hypothetical protein